MLLLVGLLVAFWLLVLRPASRRQKALVRLQEGLQVGQRVMLASGLFGTLTTLTDERAFVEIAPGVEVEVMRAAVTSIETAPEQSSTDQSSTDQSSTESAGE